MLARGPAVGIQARGAHCETKAIPAEGLTVAEHKVFVFRIAVHDSFFNVWPSDSVDNWLTVGNEAIQKKHSTADVECPVRLIQIGPTEIFQDTTTVVNGEEVPVDLSLIQRVDPIHQYDGYKILANVSSAFVKGVNIVVAGDEDVQGYWDKENKQIVLAGDAVLTTLAHEIGHSAALCHPEHANCPYPKTELTNRLMSLDAGADAKTIIAEECVTLVGS